jgi:hypothetical protein
MLTFDMLAEHIARMPQYERNRNILIFSRNQNEFFEIERLVGNWDKDSDLEPYLVVDDN